VTKLLHVIVACSENRAIGRNGQNPWQVPEDMTFFHAETAGQICVMGRICFENWPRAGRVGRRPVVIARKALPVRPGQTPPVVVDSLAGALDQAEKMPGEIYICGGQRIYEEALALPRPLRLHLTLIHAHIEGDRFFPDWRQGPWRELQRRDSSDQNYRYTFYTLERPEGTR
jgi:dihydrofolate reductase